MPILNQNEYVMDAQTSLLQVKDMKKGCLKIRFDVHFPAKIKNEHKMTILSVLAEAAEAC
jgi:hypothetical protein